MTLEIEQIATKIANAINSKNIDIIDKSNEVVVKQGKKAFYLKKSTNRIGGIGT